jgi:hypothetical protein
MQGQTTDEAPTETLDTKRLTLMTGSQPKASWARQVINRPAPSPSVVLCPDERGRHFIAVEARPRGLACSAPDDREHGTAQVPVPGTLAWPARLQMPTTSPDYHQVTNEARPPRPRWWGPDWKQVPVAMWLTVAVSATLGFIIAYVFLHHLAPEMFADSHRTLRGGTQGAGLAAAIGAVSTWPSMLVWRHAMRRRGLWGHWNER